MASGETLGLQQAATELGVHYQTAYQWVRRGQLPAVQVGRAYVIERSVLEAFRRGREQGTPPPARRARNDFETAFPRFHAALVDGDEATARRTTERYLATGTSLTDVMIGLFAPALRRIGDDWACGDTTIAVEHRATAIVHRLIAEHLHRRRGRPRGEVLVATPSGDHHELPAFMATAALRETGWKVHHLGANVPTDEIVRFAAEHTVDLVVLTASAPDTRMTAAEAVAILDAAGVAAVTNAPGMSLRDLHRAADAARTARRSERSASR